MIDVSRHELLEDVVRLCVAELFECSPELVVRCELADANRRGLRPRLEDPGRRDPLCPIRYRLMVESVDEFRAGYRGCPRAGSHRELVAKTARPSLAHAGHSKVLAQHCGGLDVEIVERHDPVQPLGTGKIGGAGAYLGLRHVPPDVVEPIDRVPRPVRVAQLFVGQKQDAASLPATLPEELVTLAVRRDAEKRQRHGFVIARRMTTSDGAVH